MPSVKTDTFVEKDLILNNWDLFEINRPIGYDNLASIELHRPDLLSIRIYGTMSYWWILLKVNHIDDIWNDMSIGMDLIIPNAADIIDWVLRVRSRKKSEEI